MEYNLADLWEAVADAIPEREALVCGERRLTYADTEDRANRLAHYLASHGIGPDDHVALLLYNGTEYLEGMLAALKLRAVPINVNYRYMEEELRYILDDCDAKAIVFHREFAPKLAAISSELPGLVTYLVRRRRRSDENLDARSVRSGTRMRSPVRPLPATSGRAPPTTSTSCTPAAPPGTRRV